MAGLAQAGAWALGGGMVTGECHSRVHWPDVGKVAGNGATG